MSSDRLLSIGDVAKRTDSSVSAIRFYADEGLIPSSRSSAGHRYFPRAVLRRVSFILIAQNLGYSLSEIKQILSTLKNERTPSKEDWEKLSRKMKGDLDRRISQLELLRDSLSSCIGCGCLSLTNCRLYNPEDRAAMLGNGPRFLLGNKYADIVYLID